MFRAVDAALLRAAVGTPATTPWPDLSSDSAADGAAWSRWITDAWGLPGVAEAVTVASPPLAAAVEAVAAGGVVQERRLRRVGESLVRYLLRMQHRSTPFGLFAGVAPVRLGDTLALSWGGEHRAIARPDAAWLAAVVEHLEEDEALLGQLMVTVDATCVVRGDRLVLPCRQPSAGGKPQEVAIRRTAPVDAILAAARDTVRLDDLVHKVGADFPDAPPGSVHRLVVQLVCQRVLITSLRPPLAATDPLGHIVTQLQTIEGVAAIGKESVAPCLLALQDRLGRPDTGSTLVQSAGWAEALKLVAAIPVAGAPSLAVDLHLDCDLVLPKVVAREAERAAAALARSGPDPQGPPAWRDYHARFLERYGPGAHVPLLELVNPDTGLGYPAGYRSSTLTIAPPAVHDRDALLLELAQLAALDGLTTVDVDDVLDQLAPGPVEQTPAHAELCFQLRSESPAQLDDGQFTLVVTGVANGAGTTTGRFLHLLDDTVRQRMTDALRRAPSLTAGAVRAQLSSPPLRVRTENVARTPVVLPQSITVAEHGHGTIRLADLTVTADARRMWLFSRTIGRPVEPVILNAVQLTDFTHPLARFLAELPRARAAVLAPFSWGPAASKLPFLPAVRYGRSILAPARWRVDAADLPPAADPWRSWDSALAALCERRRIPVAVDLGDGDRRLRLDLAQRHHRQLLRAHLDRHHRAVLRQAPTSGALSWIGGRAHELVLPLVATQQPVRRTVFAPPAVRVERWAPGAASGGWAYAKIHAHPDRHDELLARLPELTAALGPLPLWFVRYRDPDPHLRLRIWQSADAFGDLARHVDTWAAGLAEAGLASGRVQWDTYWPETGRYGSGQLMRLAEGVFVADSAAVLAQLRHTGPGNVPTPALTAAGMTDIAAGLLGSTDAGMRWLLENVDRRADAALDRDLLRRAVALADPTDTWAALRGAAGTALTEAWARRRAALDSYRRRLIALDGPRPDAVLTSLLHMHHIRAAGIAPDAERTCRRLARAAALAWTATRTPAGATR
ncbi:lantibiotic dehydratase [Kitasatospora purpeofusca]|uniref:lantibiotic dehydratase n=1 Tax=Kitasatospora purpeofusca TaxID=67352 RepID=UPI003402ABF5